IITTLAEDILTALCNGTVEPKSERFKGVVQNQVDVWEREIEPLKEIWFGLRSFRDEFMPYMEFSPVFTLWFKNNPSGFIDKLMPLNPYIAKSLLTIAGVTFFRASFASWEQTIHLVPKSFDKKGVYQKE